MKEKEKQVYQILKQYGYNDKEISGIMANISVETGGTFDYQTKQKGGKGYGLFQFDFLKKYYEKYKDQHKIQDSAKTQIQFMHSTIRGQNQWIIGQENAKKINNTFQNGTVNDITQSFCDFFQRPGVPHLQRRIKAAQNYENFFNTKKNLVQQKKMEAINPVKRYFPSQLNASSAPSLKFVSSSSQSSGFGLSSDRSNYGYSIDNGSRISTGFSLNGPNISIDIPCQII